jgi:hypothetical protein
MEYSSYSNVVFLQAFSAKQKKLILSWTQQIQKIWHPASKFPMEKRHAKTWGGSTFPISQIVRGPRPIKHQTKQLMPQYAFGKVTHAAGSIIITPGTQPALTKHNSLNSYMSRMCEVG